MKRPRALRRRYGRAKTRKHVNPECQYAGTCTRNRRLSPSKIKRAKVRALLPDDVQVGLPSGIGLNGAQVFLVDGEYVRKTFDIDFTMGSHDAHSIFIPPGEVWVEKILSPTDRKPLIAHELSERADMIERGMSYEKAHDRASAIELKMRRRG